MGSQGMCSDLASYKHTELFMKVLHIKGGQKCCCFYSKVNALWWNKRRKITHSFSAPTDQAQPLENDQSYSALCTNPRLIDLLHKLNAFINNERSSETDSIMMLSSLLHLTPLFLHFWNPGSSKAGESPWWLAHDCRLTFQSQHTIHSTEKKNDIPKTLLPWVFYDYTVAYTREVTYMNTLMERILQRNVTGEPGH